MPDEQQYALSVPAGAKPVKYRDVISVLVGEKREARSLVDHTFLILRGKPFQTHFENQPSNPWFVVCAEPETGVLFHTTLGGAAVVDVLQAYAASTPTGPLEVTLRWNEGGSFEGYYTFE